MNTEDRLDRFCANLATWLIEISNRTVDVIHMDDNGIRRLHIRAQELWGGHCDIVPFSQWVKDNRAKYIDGIYDGLIVHVDGQRYRIRIEGTAASATRDEASP